MNLEFWRRRRVLVTGHTGFKGAWLMLWLQALGAEVTGLALPPEHEEGIFVRLLPWNGVDCRFGDIREATTCTKVVCDCKPEIVFHLAAQSLVRRGYAQPAATYETNVMGAVNTLNAALATGTVKAVVVVTSDKVYANQGDGRPLREDDRLGGFDPYSSSKACAEAVVASYRASFFEPRGIPITTVRAGNVIGGGDYAEDRLLPDIFRALEQGKSVRLRYPNATRPWQHVLDPLSGYLMLAEALVQRPDEAPLAVNFGPEHKIALTVSEVAERTFDIWGRGSWEPVTQPNPPEAAALRLDSSLARDSLGWRPRLSLEMALTWTVEWHKAPRTGADMRQVSLCQIQSYQELPA